MKTFNELRLLNVSEHIEKKNGMSYLSWTYAVDTLLQNDPTATWEFLPHIEINDTIMVRCQVHAFGKTMFMHLAVFDFKNQAIKQPNASQVANSMTRCLVKCIAAFGIGLYIYAGEDLPKEDKTPNQHAPKNMQPSDEEAGLGFQANGYRIPFGSHKGRNIDELANIIGVAKIEDTIIKTEQRITENNPYSGATIEQMKKFVLEATAFVMDLEKYSK